MPDTFPPGDAPPTSRIHPSCWPPQSQPSTAADDQGFAIALARLYALPRSERLAVMAFISYWMELPRDRRAALAKAAKPDLTDGEVAKLVGRHPRSLRRWDSYQSLKPKANDYRGSERYLGFSDPRDTDA